MNGNHLSGLHILQIHSNLGRHPISKPEVGRGNLPMGQCDDTGEISAATHFESILLLNNVHRCCKLSHLVQCLHLAMRMRSLTRSASVAWTCRVLRRVYETKYSVARCSHGGETPRERKRGSGEVNASVASRSRGGRACPNLVTVIPSWDWLGLPFHPAEAGMQIIDFSIVFNIISDCSVENAVMVNLRRLMESLS